MTVIIIDIFTPPKTYIKFRSSWDNAPTNHMAESLVQKATFEFQKPSLSKWGQVHNLSCEDEFYLHENEKSFPY